MHARREVYAGSLHVATYDDSTTYFSSTDWQGTERVRSDVSGVSVETCTNLPYGDDQSCVGPLHQVLAGQISLTIFLPPGSGSKFAADGRAKSVA